MDDDWGTPISGNHRIEVTNFGVKPLGDSNWNSFRCFCFGQGFRMITFPNRMRLGVWPSLVLSTPVLTHTLPQVTSKHGGEKIKHEDWICLKIRWFSGLSWFIMVYHGLSWFIPWFIMVYPGLSWFITVYHGLSWFTTIFPMNMVILSGSQCRDAPNVGYFFSPSYETWGKERLKTSQSHPQSKRKVY